MALIIFIHVACFILYGCAETEDIIGGDVVPLHSMPYMAFVKILAPGNKIHRCGGILIRDDYVLTAAHCAVGNMNVILGAHNVEAEEEFRQEIKVCKAIPHPKYRRNAAKYDIMLLKLTKKAQLSRSILPLPIDNSYSNVKSGSVCTVAGWGQYKSFNDQLSPLLREVSLKVISRKNCSTDYPLIDIKDFICAGEEKERKTTGEGDSGSPLFCGEYLSGIVLGGQKSRKPPSLFTKVSPHKSWIKHTIETEKCKLK